MLILFKTNGKVDFSFNPSNLLSVTYFKSSIGEYWLVSLNFIGGEATEVKVTSEEVAQELTENIARAANNLAHFIINLEYTDDL